MTYAVKDEKRIVGIEAEDLGFICTNCMSLEESHRFDLFREREMEYRDYQCIRCGKTVPAPPGTYLEL